MSRDSGTRDSGTRDSGTLDSRTLAALGGAEAAVGAIAGSTEVVGVIGDPVTHSLSPLLHNAAFAALGLDWVSVAFPVVAGQAEPALAGAAALGIRGLSVTMPHKEAVAGLVVRRSPTAERLGAVNCVVRRDGGWTGENTDGAGLVAALRRGGRFDPEGRRCLVVGAGGAARAVIAALGDARAREVVVVNRTPQRAAVAARLAGASGRPGTGEAADRCELIVNATPLGMQGEEGGGAGEWPIEPRLLGPGQLVVDLVYHPLETPWLRAVRANGASGVNGLGMLVHQAALQLTAWTGLEAPVEVLWGAAEAAASEAAASEAAASEAAASEAAHPDGPAGGTHATDAAGTAPQGPGSVVARSPL